MGDSLNKKLMQQPSEYQEIAQFFGMLTLPTGLMGYKKEYVIGALLCLDDLYRNQIKELEEENTRTVGWNTERIVQQDRKIKELEQKLQVMQESMKPEGVTDAVLIHQKPDEVSRAVSEVQRGLQQMIRKAAAEAQKIHNDTQKISEILTMENQGKLMKGRHVHKETLKKMMELKRQYLSDITVLQSVLQEMQEEANEYQRKLESVQEFQNYSE